MSWPRCRATWGHYAAAFTRCERRRWHRGDHRWQDLDWGAL